MATTLNVVQHNTAPQFQITCQRDDGSIINLTNCTATLQLYRGTTKMNNGHEACTVLNATGGVIGWEPGSGDLSLPGTYKGDVVVTDVNGGVETLFQNVILKARAKLGG